MQRKVSGTSSDTGTQAVQFIICMDEVPILKFCLNEGNAFEVFYLNINKANLSFFVKKAFLLLNAKWLLIKELHAKYFGKYLVLHAEKIKLS